MSAQPAAHARGAPKSPNLLLHTVAQAMSGERAVWAYVGKVLVALYLSGWLAMRLGMNSPGTAMITVLVVMNRNTGMVLAKAFYRGVGTVVGCAMAVLIVSLFPQSPVALVTAMALWAGFCAGGSVWSRGMASYGFVLAGYTVAMIVFPVIEQPQNILNSALERTGEVLLGMAVTSVVFDVLWPNRMRAGLRAADDGNLNDFLGFVADAIGGRLQGFEVIERTQSRVVQGAIQFEDLRAMAYFDDPILRSSNGQLKLINQHFMAATSRFQALHHHMDRLRRSQDEALVSAIRASLKPLSQLLDDAVLRDDVPALAKALQHWCGQLDALFARERRALPVELQTGFDASALLVRRFAEELQAYLSAKARMETGNGRLRARGPRLSKVRFSRANDWYAIALAAVRCFVVMLALSLLWLSSSWNQGGLAVFGMAALVAMSSAAPDPLWVVRRATIGHVVAPFFAVPGFVAMALAPDFPMLVLLTLPSMIASLYISTRPRFAVIGMAMNVGILVSWNMGPHFHPSAQSFLDNSLTMAVGAFVAMGVFMLVPGLPGSKQRQRRLLERLRAQVQLAVSAPLPGLLPKFESVSRELFQQVAGRTRPGSRPSRQLFEWALLVHETGHCAIDLRHDLAEQTLPAPLHAQIERALALLGQLYRTPRARTLREAKASVHAALGELSGPQPQALRAVRDHLYLLRMSLEDSGTALAAHVQRSRRQQRLKEARHAV
ncbi:FUSC family protein [Stenotrophomonas humi]